MLTSRGIHASLSLVPPAGLVHVGDELREVNGVSVIHKRPDEISQLLVSLPPMRKPRLNIQIKLKQIQWNDA